MPNNPRISPRNRIILYLIPLVLLVVGAVWYVLSGRYVTTENAYVKANIINLSPQVTGPITSVPVATNQQVSQGQLLATIDKRPYQVAVDQAQADLNNVHDDIVAMQASYREKQAELDQARRDAAFYARELKRQEGLARAHAVSESTLDAARQKRDSANSQVATLTHALDQLKANLGGGPDVPVDQNPRYKSAEAKLHEAQIQLAETDIRAPADAIVASGPVSGDAAVPGNPLFQLVETDHVWIEANLKETELENVTPGEKATIRIDSYPGEKWDARVASISPASGAQFSLLPPQNATGNWVKVVQRIPVRLHVLARPGQPVLRAGMSAQVSIDTHSAPEPSPGGGNSGDNSGGKTTP